MSIISAASANSVWRGYDYYESKGVIKYIKISDSEYEAKVKGSNNQVYDVFLDIDHPRKSKCNCPHAKDRQIVCKHMVATYFTIFPEEAKKFMEEVAAYEKEEEARIERKYKKLREYVNSLTKDELRVELLIFLGESPEWRVDAFLNEHGYYGEDDY